MTRRKRRRRRRRRKAAVVSRRRAGTKLNLCRRLVAPTRPSYLPYAPAATTREAEERIDPLRFVLRVAPLCTRPTGFAISSPSRKISRNSPSLRERESTLVKLIKVGFLRNVNATDYRTSDVARFVFNLERRPISICVISIEHSACHCTRRELPPERETESGTD